MASGWVLDGYKRYMHVCGYLQQHELWPQVRQLKAKGLRIWRVAICVAFVAMEALATQANRLFYILLLYSVVPLYL
jgi:hypothetical protein